MITKPDIRADRFFTHSCHKVLPGCRPQQQVSQNGQVLPAEALASTTLSFPAFPHEVHPFLEEPDLTPVSNFLPLFELCALHYQRLLSPLTSPEARKRDSSEDRSLFLLWAIVPDALLSPQKDASCDSCYLHPPNSGNSAHLCLYFSKRIYF